MLLILVDVMRPGDIIKSRWIVQVPTTVEDDVYSCAQRLLASHLSDHPELFNPAVGEHLVSEPLEFTGGVVNVW